MALAAREHLIDGHLASEERAERADAKRIAYLSMEFLVGRLLGETLTNLGLREVCRAVQAELGGDLDAALAAEPDAALGNGGLGRLAACFMESLATLDLPAIGYGIHYEFGLFRQELDNGRQRERPDNWLAFGTPWTIERPDEACAIPVYGRVEGSVDRRGGYNPLWLDWRLLVGVPHDLLIAGYGGRTVNPLRLVAARASTEFDMAIFNDSVCSTATRTCIWPTMRRTARRRRVRRLATAIRWRGGGRRSAPSRGSAPSRATAPSGSTPRRSGTS